MAVDKINFDTEEEQDDLDDLDALDEEFGGSEMDEVKTKTTKKVVQEEPENLNATDELDDLDEDEIEAPKVEKPYVKEVITRKSNLRESAFSKPKPKTKTVSAATKTSENGADAAFERLQRYKKGTLNQSGFPEANEPYKNVVITDAQITKYDDNNNIEAYSISIRSEDSQYQGSKYFGLQNKDYPGLADKAMQELLDVFSNCGGIK